MRHQLTRFMCRLRCPSQMPSAPLATAYLPLNQALEQAAGLDARTGWPTHRIRCFLGMQRPSRKAS